MRKFLLVWIGLCLALAGCGARPEEAVPATSTPAGSTAAPAQAALTPTPTQTVWTPGAEIPWAPWPTHNWTTATPEQVGMDSARLLTMLDLLFKQNLNLHSLVIIRRGYLVLEVNPYPYQVFTPQDIQSCTKSVTSLLVGVALNHGYLKSLDQKVLSFFPNRTVANLDARKKAMTVRDLLTMTSGLNWPEATISYSSRENPLRAMWSSADPVQYVLDRPMAAEPGKTFEYNTGAGQLLGAILEQTTGQKLSEYATANLFEPLGIQSYSWHKMKGVESGGLGLALTPRSMAKLGYLALRGGLWENKQVVPSGWLDDSTRKQVDTSMHNGYGYLWWVNLSDSSYDAAGFGGQFIHVYPQQDLVVVTGGAMNQTQRTTLRNLIDFFVLPSIVSDTSLAASAAADEVQARALQAAARPAARPVAPLPIAALEISGRSYTLETNSLNWRQVKLEFSGTEANLTIQFNNGETHKLVVGLDGVPRLNDTLSTLLSGSWDSDHTFTLRYELLGDADGRSVRFEFNGRAVQITTTSFVQMDVTSIKGQAAP